MRIGRQAIGDRLKTDQFGAEVMCTGGSEAAMPTWAIGGFDAMRAALTRMTTRPAPAGTFDRDRDGFSGTKGRGGMIVIAAEEEVGPLARWKARIHASCSAMDMSADGTQTHPPDEEAEAPSGQETSAPKSPLNPESVDTSTPTAPARGWATGGPRR